MILVVGSTGQLGFVIVKNLLKEGQTVKALVRKSSDYAGLREAGAELAFGDLKDKSSLEAACESVDTVIATANVVIPSGKYSFKEDEGQGYTNLIAACQAKGVKRFIFLSVPVTPVDTIVPTQIYKRKVEKQLQSSALEYTIFRGSVFMDIWFALIGSSIPLKGVEKSSIRRKFWFSKAFFGLVKHSIEKRGIALVAGSKKIRHAFITEKDVASIVVNSVGHPAASNKIFELGGPQVLSWDEVAGIYGKLLGRKVRALHAPTPVFRVGFYALKPFSQAASNIMGLNLVCGMSSTEYDSSKLAAFISEPLTTVEEFLQAKIKGPANQD